MTFEKAISQLNSIAMGVCSFSLTGDFSTRKEFFTLKNEQHVVVCKCLDFSRVRHFDKLADVIYFTA